MKDFVLGHSEGKVPRNIDVQRLVDTRLLIQANSGGGKSWCLRRILERTHGQLQHLVIDLEGEFASLRERHDYVLAAKKGGDTAADPRSAKLLAERLLELGVSAILDIYDLKAHERISFVRRFLEALVDAPKRLWHPTLVVVDEAHVFCPEQGKAESAGAVIDLATRGRKRGFCAILATQRLAKLHKDAAAECNNKLIGRTGLDVDLKRAVAELGYGKEKWPALRGLHEGEFFAFGPAISREVELVRVGTVKTSHPKAGARLTFTAPSPTAKVKALLPKLADLPAEAEERERTQSEMKKEIARLKRELRAKPRPAQPAKVETRTERVEVAALGKRDLARIETASTRMEKALGPVTEALAAVAAGLAKVSQNGHGGKPVPQRIPRATASAPRKPETKPTKASTYEGEAIPRSRQRIIDALAFLEAIGLERAHKTQLALMADTKPTSGGYFNNLGSLRSAGLIDYPAPSFVSLTDAGRSIADAGSAPSTSEELHEHVRSKLPASKWRLLELAIEHYPEAIAKDALAELAGVSPTSGGYFNNLGSLRSLGLIDYPEPGHVVALPVLFLEGV